MPFEFAFDPVNGIACGRMEGPVNDAELQRYYRAAEQFAVLTGARAGVVDLTGVTSFQVSSDTVRELAQRRPAGLDPSRPRVIIASASVVFGMARMFEVQGRINRPNLHVVHTHREAWAILGVINPKFSPYPG